MPWYLLPKSLQKGGGGGGVGVLPPLFSARFAAGFAWWDFPLFLFVRYLKGRGRAFGMVLGGEKRGKWASQQADDGIQSTGGVQQETRGAHFGPHFTPNLSLPHPQEGDRGLRVGEVTAGTRRTDSYLHFWGTSDPFLPFSC